MHKSLLCLVAVTVCLAAACGGTTTEADHPLDTDASPAEASIEAGGQDVAPDLMVDDWPGYSDATEEPVPPDGDVPDEAAPPDQVAPDVVVVDSDGVSCGDKTCAPGLLCCASVVDGGPTFECAAQCPDGGAPMECDGPEDCGGAQCCVQIEMGAGTPPDCPLKAAGATCKADCPTQPPMACPSTGQGQLCHTSNDCIDSLNPTCCTFERDGMSVTFCVNSMIAPFASSCN